VSRIHKNKINGVPDSLTEELIKLIIAHKPVKRIVLYGSRATNNFRKTSDIDIAIVDENWVHDDISLVHFNLEEDLSTPLKIDLVNFYNVSKQSMKDAISKGITLYES
jgi:predicted nucleotidyltransferase